MHDTLGNYINSLPIRTITDDEEREMLRRAKAGDRAALDVVCEQNARGCVQLAHQFMREMPCPAIEFEEAVAAHLRSLPRAVNTYDESKNTRFMTHMRHWCFCAYRKLIISTNFTKINSRIANQIQLARNLADGIRRTGAEPTCEEIAEKIGLQPRPANLRKIDRWINGGFINTKVSLDEAVDSADGDSPVRMEFLEDPKSDFREGLIRQETIRRALDALASLPETHRMVMDDWLRQIKQNVTAGKLRVTHQRVSAIQREALEMIRARIQ